MAYRTGGLLNLKSSHPSLWRAQVRTSITRHQGILRRCANDLDISYSTLKRWVLEDPALKKLIITSRHIRQGYFEEE
jgi:hypothetical protein